MTALVMQGTRYKLFWNCDNWCSSGKYWGLALSGNDRLMLSSWIIYLSMYRDTVNVWVQQWMPPPCMYRDIVNFGAHQMNIFSLMCRNKVNFGNAPRRALFFIDVSRYGELLEYLSLKPFIDTPSNKGHCKCVRCCVLCACIETL